jgi:hypothetical protein
MSKVEKLLLDGVHETDDHYYIQIHQKYVDIMRQSDGFVVKMNKETQKYNSYFTLYYFPFIRSPKGKENKRLEQFLNQNELRILSNASTRPEIKKQYLKAENNHIVLDDLKDSIRYFNNRYCEIHDKEPSKNDWTTFQKEMYQRRELEYQMSYGDFMILFDYVLAEFNYFGGQLKR